MVDVTNSHDLYQKQSKSPLNSSDFWIELSLIFIQDCRWNSLPHHAWQHCAASIREMRCNVLKHEDHLSWCCRALCSCVWCKQLYSSGHDEPWTVITYTAPTETPRCCGKQNSADSARFVLSQVLVKTWLCVTAQKWWPSEEGSFNVGCSPTITSQYTHSISFEIRV